MTIWEHFFWREVEFCKTTDRAVIEFKDVDNRVLEWAKATPYTPPSSPPPSEDASA